MINVVNFVFGRILASNAGAESSDATRIGAATALIPFPMGFVAAVALGRAAVPPPPQVVVPDKQLPPPEPTETQRSHRRALA